ncbi:helix-turn-helix domain-containing protein [Natronolimnohabitans sp. A-GB9]|uniref:TrmB family transcriptional regulator n=1 Tax=Natronolimnohabitans sp. A-GB9 TaxID=3069757 RepID=UPI0027AFB626|nr:helix-turn-helix domain-containing protein [Natronolimnohabitans sp. A-GB9]MDQ2049968.1 helix-turn-helix domain-containing protein [Natronolimnohabitans sp. A-GB9]
MTQDETTAEAVSLLQELGLQEYEARCFIALNRLPSGTAKEIHELSDVPRTRVYDAIRVLESQGLVEVQHSSPQRYRAVGIDEATRILRRKYTDRVDTLETHLRNIDVRKPTNGDPVQEIWSLTGSDAITSRTIELVENAESEVTLLVVDEDVLSEALFDELQRAVDRDVSVRFGGQTASAKERVESHLSDVRVVETDMDWLTCAEHGGGDEVAISRILLVDRETLLIGSYYPGNDETTEQAVFANGLQNGIVVLLRRLVNAGLSSTENGLV